MHKNTYIFPAMLLLLFSVVSLKAQVLGTSTVEQYNYRYIIELYDAGDSRTLSNEVYQFQAKYPNSKLLPYVRFIDANLAMESGNYAKAKSIYAELVKIDLSREVFAEMLLNYASCMAATGDYTQALHLLQRVDSEIADPTYSAEATRIRADVYNKMGHSFTALIYYREALVHFPDDSDLKYGLFTSLINTQNDGEALELLWKEDPDSELYPEYVKTWLNYLLSVERYLDFDAFVRNNELARLVNSLILADLKVRKALLVRNFAEVDSLLAKWETPNSRFKLYKGLLLVNSGNASAADSLFKVLVTDSDPDIAIPAYIERLKILYTTEPISAITQLSNYIRDYKSNFRKGELLYTLGYFCYHKDDYPEAIKQLTLAKRFELNRELSGRIDILLAEAWFAAGRLEIARDAFNRYLNQYPQGYARDRALFYLGYINYTNKDYASAKQSFNLLKDSFSQSDYMQDTYYFLGEMDFFLANYNYALVNYLSLLQLNPENQQVALRIAQSYYYLGDYANCGKYLNDLYPSYESSILKGNVFMQTKNYSAALDQFVLAESFTTDRLRKAEAQSYRALCLYQMKRFKEASQLYLKLSSLGESPDTYLFLSAKSAYSAGDYHQALSLLDTFVDSYPDSKHYLSALNDIANTYYNMGNFKQAITDWLNILKRFRNNTRFDEQELTVVRDALLGVELAVGRFSNNAILEDITALTETFASEYIGFELSLIVLKSYAKDSRWAELINAAEAMRTEYPKRKNEEISLLMASGLMALNQYESADSLLLETYNQHKSPAALVKWAELDVLGNDYRSAFDKYSIAYRDSAVFEIWLNLLECSSQLDYFEFETLWEYRNKYPSSYSTANKFLLRYLYNRGRLVEAISLADELLNTSLSQYDHALAFLIGGLIELKREDYPAAFSSLNKTIILFPEFRDIQMEAVVNLVSGLFRSGARTDAIVYYRRYQHVLDEDASQTLKTMLGLAE